MGGSGPHNPERCASYQEGRHLTTHIPIKNPVVVERRKGSRD